MASNCKIYPYCWEMSNQITFNNAAPAVALLIIFSYQGDRILIGNKCYLRQQKIKQLRYRLTDQKISHLQQYLNVRSRATSWAGAPLLCMHACLCDLRASRPCYKPCLCTSLCHVSAKGTDKHRIENNYLCRGIARGDGNFKVVATGGCLSKRCLTYLQRGEVLFIIKLLERSSSLTKKEAE